MLVERRRGVLQHVKFVEHNFGVRQDGDDRVEIRLMHVGRGVSRVSRVSGLGSGLWEPVWRERLKLALNLIRVI